MTELVSCVMPTADRRAFVPRAIELFLAQDHEERELLILDDGDDAVADLVPDDPRVRYERLDRRLVLGEKRNLGCELARGDLVAHWDDDDWYAPRRLSSQVAALARDATLLCGVGTLLFHDVEDDVVWRYRYPRHDPRPWVAGSSMLYRRELWARQRFAHVARGEDTRFAWAVRPAEVTVLDDLGLVVATIHAANTTTRVRRGPRWTRHDGPLPTAPLAAPPPASGTVRPTTVACRDRPAVSACLLSWRRPHHLPRIVASLRRHAFIDEVLVWNNDPAVRLELGDDVRVIASPRNVGCHGRYLCAAEARNELVYTQDDDAIVHDVEDLYDAYLRQPDRLAHGLAPKHFAARDDLVFGDAQLGWVGWGAIFPRSWVACLDRLPDRIRHSHGFEREADVYFSILLRQHHTTRRAQVSHLPGHSRRGEALYLDPGATALRTRAIRSALIESRRLAAPHAPPLWNVVVTCYRYGHFLPEAVASVLDNRADAVVTIVDDRSGDGSLDVARRLAGEHHGVEVVARTHNGGPGAAANSGIGHTDSAFVVRLDADDRIGPDYLRTAERVLVGGADVANPDAILFGAEHGRWRTPATTSRADLLRRNRVHCAAAFRRGLWIEASGFDEHLPKWVDYDFWLRVAARGARIVRCPGDQFHYRRHPGSLTHTGPAAEEMRDRLRRRHPDLV